LAWYYLGWATVNSGVVVARCIFNVVCDFRNYFLATLVVAGSWAIIYVPDASAKSPASPVTYQQILEQPDNLELVFTYAREQAEDGNLQPAAGALERLLLLEPKWDSARLFYAIVLYRLNDLDGALRELIILEGRELTPQQMAGEYRYKDLASHSNSATRLSGWISAGFRYDTNRTLASDRDLGFDGVAGPIALIVPKRDDGAFVADLKLRL
jgi:hypothetical protein